MSSPFRESTHSSSSRRSTPSRNAANGIRRLNGYHRSNLSSPTPDSPSHQLLEDLSRMLINDERSFKLSLDEQTAAQQKLHLEALDRALAIHQEVRESAERVREQVELELERDRRRRGEEERKAVEKARRELEEQKFEEEKRRIEEAKAKEVERQRHQQLKLDQENLERKKVEADRRQQEEARQREESRKKEEEAKKAQQSIVSKSDTSSNGVQNLANSRQDAGVPAEAKPQVNGALPVQAPQTSGAPVTATHSANNLSSLPAGLITDAEERETVHNQYLELHKRLKQMRIQVMEECKRIPKLKDQVSDWRRAIVKCCGQMSKGTTDKAKQGNRRAISEIQTILDAAVQVAEPSIDVTQYIVENRQPPNADPRGPAVLVLLLNHFAKGVIKQLISESSVDPKTADTLGVLAVTIFARPQYLLNGQSLIDILWAKYHVHCPVLFGISGSERTKAGRLRLGWEYDKADQTFAKPQSHYDRMSGLGAGFASITLRDFSKSKNANPAPNRIWWQAVARIVNTPAAEVQPSHFIVLKAIIAQDVTRILKCFGGAGVALLRAALITFPNERGPQDDKGNKIAAVGAVQAIAAVLERDFQLKL